MYCTRSYILVLVLVKTSETRHPKTTKDTSQCRDKRQMVLLSGTCGNCAIGVLQSTSTAGCATCSTTVSLALLYSRVYILSKCNTTMFPHESRQKYTDYTHRKESRDLHTLIPPPQRTCPALSGLSPNLKKRAELLVCGRVAIVDAWGMRGWDVFSVRVSGS